MQAPNIPADETLRLMTLRSLNLLDSPQDDRFDRLARLAQRMFDVPLAMVTLIDADRQWMKSCIGREPMALPREISFCGHAILGDDVFVIPDMITDSRFCDNPLVTEEGVRFYAGCPIKSSNGSKLGTLCVIDLRPRTFSEAECESLTDLAAMVELEIASFEQATHDLLTGLLNRRGFELLASNDMNLCKRNSSPACVALLDLNKFKSINDRFGHQEGDSALASFSNIVQSVSRNTDLVSRLGGDEFAIFLMGTSLENANVFVKKLQAALAEFNSKSNKPYEISFSIGVVEVDVSRHNDLHNVLLECDALMYKSK